MLTDFSRCHVVTKGIYEPTGSKGQSLMAGYFVTGSSIRGEIFAENGGSYRLRGLMDGGSGGVNQYQAVNISAKKVQSLNATTHIIVLFR